MVCDDTLCAGYGRHEYDPDQCPMPVSNERGRSRTQWTLVKQPLCDLCSKRAAWAHPAGGLRCVDCPRPECTHLRCAAGSRRCLDCGMYVPYEPVVADPSPPLRPSSQQTTETIGVKDR